jgi:SAM-dependent methyltransferase
MNEYWEKRFTAEGRIWGDAPSRTAEYALDKFREAGVKKVLVPGSGYGRNTKLFSDAGMDVTGVEISSTAFGWAQTFDTSSRFYNSSALDMSFIAARFDAVYCFNVLHLFRKDDRKLFIQQCVNRLKNSGVMFFTAFSEKEDNYGKGQEVEQNTFESKAGRPAHYFTEDDLKTHFRGMQLLEQGMMADPENHGAEGPHTHQLRYIYVKAKP